MLALAATCALALAVSGPRPQTQGPSVDQQAQETIAEVRVHGNHISTDDEILKIAGITIGAPFTATTIADVRKRLRDSGKFDDVDVLKRFASIEDMSKIVVVVIVNEGPVRIDVPEQPDQPIQVLKRRGFRNLMFLPIFEFEDGYSGTFGVRFALVNIGGERGRLSFPLTMGGTRRAGVEYDRTFTRGPLSRVEVGTNIQRRKNPGFDVFDRRERVWVRAERSFWRVRTGVTGMWQHVHFAPLEDTLQSLTADIVLDTRLDPLLPRNAVYAAASWERIEFESGGQADRTRVDARGYLGLIGQTVLVARAVREDANRPLPPYLKSLLGGWSSLRGFAAGAFIGDIAVSGSLELRVPLTTPLSVGKIGVSAFIDAGKAYDKGTFFDDVELERGVGGSVWLTAGPLKVSFSVARGLGRGTRVNFGGGLSF
jgi:outer membrane protein assembly factor BamA